MTTPDKIKFNLKENEDEEKNTKQLASPEALEELEAPGPDMFLEDGQKDVIADVKQDIKNSPEKQENKEIKTAADFLEVLENEILKLKENEDEEKGIKLAYHLIKIKGALRQAKIRPEKLNLMSLSNDEMVDYDENKKKLKVRKDILEDIGNNQPFLATIFSEIQLERKEDVKDTGFQLLTLKKKISIKGR